VADFEQMFKQAQGQVQQKNRQLKRMREQLSSKNREIRQMHQQLAGEKQKPVGLERQPDQSFLVGGIQDQTENTYETLYEAHARAHSAEDAVGGGSFDLIGRLELEVLLMEGLKPTDTLLDFGCGTGRLAIHAIPTLVGGCYIGIDISQSMLDEAQRCIQEKIPGPQCQILWAKQTTPAYPLDAGSVDMICAFSVFTHMEHEDTYRYLKEALRIIRPGGRFILSCLPMNLKLAQNVFLKSAEADLQARWSEVRNVTTSVDFMTEIAELAGWTPVRWYDGEKQNIQLPESRELHALGQSVCVLQA
jgi:ubiquinone/menaquinone biosynthesis C-methylase UbiE